MWTSSTAIAARIADSGASRPAHRSTSIGRSRLPPALSVALASARRTSPWPATILPRRDSTADICSGSQEAAASITWVTGAGIVEPRGPSVVHDFTPEWMAMIPPASSSHRTSSRPAASILAARLSGEGKRFTDCGRYV